MVGLRSTMIENLWGLGVQLANVGKRLLQKSTDNEHTEL